MKFFFDLTCEIFNNKKTPGKITRYGVNLQRENVFAVSHGERKPENDPTTKMNRATIIKKTHQLQSIKSNKEVIPKTRETFIQTKSHSDENTKSGQKY